MSEQIEKLGKIRSFMEAHRLDALYLQRAGSFAWATCGSSSYINTASSDGLASLLITAQDNFLITTNIEAPRFELEEKLAERGWTFRVTSWYETANVVSELSKGLKLGADCCFPGAVDVSNELARYRSSLTIEEQTRFRDLGHMCAEAMHETILGIQPGMTEYQIASLLASAAEKRGVQAIVNLIATDERIFNFRHPLPTDKKMEKYAMVVLCGRRWGLVCSITRLVHFGRLSDELSRKMNAVAEIDASFIHFTRPGARLNQVFQQAVHTYAKTGFAEEWKLHHQGGPAGFEPREFIVTPASTEIVTAGQVYAWNPSITGMKSEDTILIGTEANEVLTKFDGWPELHVVIEGKEYSRPAVLVVT